MGDVQYVHLADCFLYHKTAKELIPSDNSKQVGGGVMALMISSIVFLVLVVHEHTVYGCVISVSPLHCVFCLFIAIATYTTWIYCFCGPLDFICS